MPLWRHTTDDDRSLGRQVGREGSEVAFRQLYRRHAPALRRLFESMLDDPRDIDDGAQEAWIVAVERIADFRWDASFRTWLLGIGLNVARAMRRRGWRHQTLPLDMALAVPASAPAELLDLDRALASLPPGYREVLQLHDVEGYSHAEIAQRLGIAAGTSKSQLFQARRALRALLEPGETDK